MFSKRVFFQKRSWLAGLVCALIFLCAVLTGSFKLPSSPVFDEEAELGRILIYGFPAPPGPGVSWQMPLPIVNAALLSRALKAKAEAYWNWMAFTALLTLMGALMLFLDSWVAALAGLLLFLIFCRASSWEYEQSVYLIPILLAVIALVRRVQRPGFKSDAIAGCAIGMTLLCRSHFALFPIALAFWEFFASQPVVWRQRLKRALPILAVPYLFLLPTVFMNWKIHHKFMPLEFHRANANIVTGLLGLVPTVDESWESLLESPPSQASGGILRQALWEAMRHPLRYLQGFFGRLAFAAALQPVLFVLALLALWIFRKREELRPVVLVAAYLLFFHCLFSVEEAYFTPLWPLLASMAALLVSAGSAASGTCRSLLTERAAFQVWRIWFLAFSAASVTAMFFVLTYPAQAVWNFPETLEASLKKYPQDAWLLRQRAMRWIEAGSFEAGLKDLETANRIDPSNKECGMEEIAARAYVQDCARVLEQIPSAEEGPRPYARWLKALAYLRCGRSGEAKEAMLSAWSLHLSNPKRIHRVETGMEKRAWRRLQDRAGATFIQAYLGGPLVSWPARDRLELIRQLNAAIPADQPLWIGQTELALRSQDYRLAAVSFREAAKLGPVSFQERRPLLLALRDLRDREGFMEMARLLRKDYPEESAEFWLGIIAVFNESADYAAIERILPAADSPGIAASQEHEVALWYQALSRYPRALSIMKDLAVRYPGKAVYHKDKGILEFLSGSPKKALRDLERAIELEPRMFSAYQSAAAIYENEGNSQKAGALMERALSAEPLEEERPLVQAFKEKRNK